MTDRYTVILEDAGSNYGAYIPDLPGCVSTGATIEETVTNIREAMAFHLGSMRRDGDMIPPPTTRVTDSNLELGPEAIGVIEVRAGVLTA